MHATYTNFCSGRVFHEVELDGTGAKGANAAFIPAIFLKGVRSSIKTIPMLNICTPPPDM